MSVIICTGIVAAFFAAKYSAVAAIAVIVFTSILSVLVWRFATVHADGIGEARFNNIPIRDDRRIDS